MFQEEIGRTTMLKDEEDEDEKRKRRKRSEGGNRPSSMLYNPYRRSCRLETLWQIKG